MRNMTVGVVAAIFAAACWSLNFVVPFVVGDFTIFDIALVRFVVSACIGVILFYGQKSRILLTSWDWSVVALLAFVGYVGYFLSVTAAAVFAGPVIAPAFLGLVPVIVALAGNLRQRTISWRRLATPLAVILTGLFLVNRMVFGDTTPTSGDVPLGIALSLVAVLFWTWFALANQAALADRPDMSSTLWTAAILIASGVQMVLFLPIGSELELFVLTQRLADLSSAIPLFFWGALLALLSSVAGAAAWTIAARSLPIALSAQLVVLETVFGAVFGLAVRGQWPDLYETAGITLLILGVVVAVRVFYDVPSTADASNAPSAPKS